jgi:hypothetical protein
VLSTRILVTRLSQISSMNWLPCWQLHSVDWQSMARRDEYLQVQGIRLVKEPSFASARVGRGRSRRSGISAQEGKRRCNRLVPAKRRAAGIGGVIPRPEESLPRTPVPAVPLPWAQGRLCPRLNAYVTADSRQNSCAEFDATISHSTRSCGPGTRDGWSPPVVPQTDFAKGIAVP